MSKTNSHSTKAPTDFMVKHGASRLKEVVRGD